MTQADIDDNGGGDGDIDNTATADSDQTEPVTDSAAVPLDAEPGAVDREDGDAGSTATRRRRSWSMRRAT